MRKLAVVLLLGSLLCPTMASAQLAVADAPVLAAVGSAVVALKSILDETRRQLAELTHWSQVVQQVRAIAQLVTDVEALIVEIQTVNQGWAQLSDSGSTLCTLEEAMSWKSQGLQWQQKAFAVGRKAQSLLGRGLAVLADIDVVLNGILGPTGGAQASSAILAVIAGEVAELQMQSASLQSALVGRDLIDSMLGIQLVCIQNNAFANWGSYSR